MQHDTNHVEQDIEKSKITADQVAWVGNALDRYAKQIHACFGDPRRSRTKKVSKLAAMLEILDVFNLEFGDKYAAMNAIADMEELDIIDPRATCTEHPK